MKNYIEDLDDIRKKYCKKNTSFDHGSFNNLRVNNMLIYNIIGDLYNINAFKLLINYNAC
jgi:hypothetical protein